jgi:hypothetical protein
MEGGGAKYNFGGGICPPLAPPLLIPQPIGATFENVLLNKDFYFQNKFK